MNRLLSCNTSPFSCDNSISNDSIDIKIVTHKLLETPCFENMTLHTSDLTTCSTFDANSTIDGDDDIENDWHLASPASLRPSRFILPSSPRRRQRQQNDKISPFHDFDLSLVTLPSLPDIPSRDGENNHVLRDLSQLPLPKRIRLAPRKRKVVSKHNIFRD